MSGFSVESRVSRLSVSALAVIVAVLVGIISVVAVISSQQLALYSDTQDMAGAKSNPITMPRGMS